MKKNITQKLLAILLCFALLFGNAPQSAFAETTALSVSTEVANTVDYYKNVQNKNITSFWEALALYGAGEKINDGTWLIPNYTITEISKVQSYASAILVELAKGSLPSPWIDKLKSKQDLNDGKFSNALNDHIFAMIALDAANSSYDREKAISFLISNQNTDGGFAWYTGGGSDIDMTGMALIALGKYRSSSDLTLNTSVSVVKALAFLKTNQVSSGGFHGAYGNNSNSDAAGVLGLVAAGENVESGAWTKTDTNAGTSKTPLDSLLAYRTGDGGFGYTNNSKTNSFATQQVLLALDDISNNKSTFDKLSEELLGKKSIYFIGNDISTTTESSITFNLYQSGFSSDVTPAPVEGADFSISKGGAPVDLNPSITSGGGISIAFKDTDKYVLTASKTIEGTPYSAVLEIYVNEKPAALQKINISVRVEGSTKNIESSKSFDVYSSSDSISASDAVAQFLDSKWIPYFMNYYGYISEINNEAAGKYGGYDGWLGAVNGDLNIYNVKDGDDVIFFYGDFPQDYDPSTYIPTIKADTANYKLGNPLDIEVTSTYDVTEWDPITYEPISTVTKNIVLPDVDVKINNWTGKTDANGKITIPALAINKGLQSIDFSQEHQDRTPGIVRTTLSFTPAEVTSGDGTQLPQGISLIVKGVNGSTIKTATLDYKKGASALSVLLEQTNLNVVVTGRTGSRYVRSIDGLSEFDYGTTSGWMYLVNGSAPSVSSDAYKLSDGDEVRWLYTKNMGADIGANDNLIPAGAIEISTLDRQNAKATMLGIFQNIKTIGIQDEFELAILAGNNSLDIASGKSFIEDHVKNENGTFTKSTDISKILIGAKALGMDPHSISGFDLLNKLFNFEEITKQGVNGPIFALLAYDVLKVEIPAGSINTREKLISDILSFQNVDGGFSLASGGKSNPDLTAMALTSLSRYMSQAKAKASVEKGLLYLSKIQQNDGSYMYEGVKSSETISQVIIALTSLNIGLDDSRFTKENGNLISALLAFKKDAGFSHILKGEVNDLATRQGAMALTSYQMSLDGYAGIFDFKPQFATFKDIDDVAWAKDAINSLSRKNIINGYDNGSFMPKNKVTREQLTKMLLLALKPDFVKADSNFSDVPKGSWYEGYIGAAEKLGIIKGISEKAFGSGKNVSREDFAVMANRLSVLVGKDLKNTNTGSLADMGKVSTYAKESVENLYGAGIITGKLNGNFEPKESCTRAEAAVILYRLMQK